jgi:DNA mismatch repair protein MLH1
MTTPGRIRKLDAATVNRIAAGEVIHRPAHALKELLENALDAGAKSVSILAIDGGLKLLQVSDTGSGIQKEDLHLVCERFTTSKLRTFDELLQGVQTFGFRGEALASMTHVARVCIRTKTAESPVAWTGEYSDGALIGALKPIAGVTGTQVSVCLSLIYHLIKDSHWIFRFRTYSTMYLLERQC